MLTGVCRSSELFFVVADIACIVGPSGGAIAPDTVTSRDILSASSNYNCQNQFPMNRRFNAGRRHQEVLPKGEQSLEVRCPPRQLLKVFDILHSEALAHSLPTVSGRCAFGSCTKTAISEGMTNQQRISSGNN